MDSLHRGDSDSRRALGGPSCRILDAMVWLESGRIPMPFHRTVVAYAADHVPRSGGFQACCAILKRCELVSYNAAGLVLEQDGREVADAPVETFTRADYFERMEGKLSPLQRAICRAVRESERGMTRGDMSKATVDVANVPSSVPNALAKLLAIELLAVSGGIYTATPALVPLNVFELRERALASDQLTRRNH